MITATITTITTTLTTTAAAAAAVSYSGPRHAFVYTLRVAHEHCGHGLREPVCSNNAAGVGERDRVYVSGEGPPRVEPSSEEGEYAGGSRAHIEHHHILISSGKRCHSNTVIRVEEGCGC